MLGEVASRVIYNVYTPNACGKRTLHAVATGNVVSKVLLATTFGYVKKEGKLLVRFSVFYKNKLISRIIAECTV